MLAASWLGTIPGWLTLGALVGLAFLLRGGQLGPAIGYLREANSTLTDENKALAAKVVTLTAENVELKSRPDLVSLQTALLAQMKAHEDRAQERHTASLVVLDLIAARLGPDAEAHGRLLP